MYIKLFNSKIHFVKRKHPMTARKARHLSSTSSTVFAILNLESTTYFFFFFTLEKTSVELGVCSPSLLMASLPIPVYYPTVTFVFYHLPTFYK